jgi:Zn-dependent M28 family amino/carboxypeptidase
MKRPVLVFLLLVFVLPAVTLQPFVSNAFPRWPAGSTPDFPPIDGKALLAHIRVLSSDQFEGRAPGGRGEDLTINYIEDQFRKRGLEPGNADASYFQEVPMVGITPGPAVTLLFSKGSKTARLKYLADFVAWTRRVAPTTSLNDSPLVFVGYGVQAPEYDWDDYKGLDVRGKTLVMLVNDPPVPDPSDPARLDPKVFGGDTMTYYGRWTYKFDIGAAKGAAGILLVHETGPAGYPWSVVESFGGERFDLLTPDRNMSKASLEGWLSLGQARKVFAMAGQNFDTLRKQAAGRGFRPVTLEVAATVDLRNRIREIKSHNVLARLEGSSPQLRDECLVYTAHWDHFGIGQPVDGDRTYHGAVDNASGVAGLVEIAGAFAKLPERPKRSILFFATTGEEQGLIGAEYYVANPIFPLTKTLAVINLDGLNVYGQTKDVTLIGLGNSELDDYARRTASAQGRVIRADPDPEKGFFYRSDHFCFVKRGVPALDPASGIEYVGKPADFGRKVRGEYTAHDYHKPSDKVKAGWDMRGTIEDLQLLWMVGYEVANADRYPQWKPGSEFKSTRDAQLKAAGMHE